MDASDFMFGSPALHFAKPVFFRADTLCANAEGFFFKASFRNAAWALTLYFKLAVAMR